MATSGAKSAGEGNGARSAQDLNADIQQLREDMAQLTQHLREIGSHSMSRAQQTAREQADQWRGTAEELQQDLTDMVREKPLTALALAAGVGYLFAMITRR